MTEKQNLILIGMPGQTIGMLYEERRPLYEKYADIVVSTAGMTPDQVVAKIHMTLKTLSNTHWPEKESSCQTEVK